ncbi:MAG: PQQ-binding-like beta-propeller repeat protein [Verrucomicrobiales bacterium]|nr:PQQ-binding-like beta-propeller repeat protein [Verrucomicrobiales bacterium]
MKALSLFFVAVACFTIQKNATAENPATVSETHGGLVVQIGADDTETPIELSKTGRFLIHVVDSDAKKIGEVQNTFQKNARYGLVWAELQAGEKLPYSEHVVNLIRVTKSEKIALEEIFRVLTPLGNVVISDPKLASKDALEKAGFEAITEKEGALVARKPWPEAMDEWSHPRHDANGNAVSSDTLVGPPDRVRWVAAATSEVEGLVSASGRNYYGGLLARDSFNGLRLWHHDLGKGETNSNEFKLPRLSNGIARPVASDKYLFAISKGVLTSFNSATGEKIREFKGIEKPNDLIYHRSTVVATSATSIRAYSAETGEELWGHDFAEARNVAAGDDTVTLIHGRPKRGEKSTATALDLYSGKKKWEKQYDYLDNVYRTVMFGEQMAFEVSSLNDNDNGNAIHIISNETGNLAWEKFFPPGMNHKRQARAMFLNDDIWILHGGKENYEDKANMKRVPVEVSALDPKTGKTKKTHAAGLAHCFPPVATPNFVISGELDMTNIETGDVEANRITKANCSRENGWVPANGLVYTTPKHCTCWPMLRGFVAMAAKTDVENHPAHRPVDQIDFTVERGPAKHDPKAASPAKTDWPMYRNGPWRSGSTGNPGPKKLAEKWSTEIASPIEVAAAKADGPAGPILHDWQENPFIKGPVSAPVIANGSVFVARPDAHQVVSLSAENGAENWRFTATGRVDTPPAIHKGLAIFGTNSGYVYALRADSGEQVWRMKAAPADERIVAYGQVESAWPVSGAVLIHDEIAYFAAGRQPLADGGVLVFAINPITAEKHWVTRVDSVPQKGFYENSGLEFDPYDILHIEGDALAFSRWILKRDGSGFEVDKWNAFAKLDTGSGDVWVPRGSWTYGPRHQHRFRGEAPRRPLAIWRDGKVISSLNGSTELFLREFSEDDVKNFKSKWITGWEAAQKGNKGEKPFRTYRIAEGAKWTADPFIAEEDKGKKFVPGTQVYNDVHALSMTGDGRIFAIHKDGRMVVMAAEDGKILEEKTVPEPAWDGLAVANGKLFLTTLDGRLMCLGE